MRRDTSRMPPAINILHCPRRQNRNAPVSAGALCITRQVVIELAAKRKNCGQRTEPDGATIWRRGRSFFHGHSGGDCSRRCIVEGNRFGRRSADLDNAEDSDKLTRSEGRDRERSNANGCDICKKATRRYLERLWGEAVKANLCEPAPRKRGESVPRASDE